MSRGKLSSRQHLDATLLSTSAIGSPAAFSTAIKPPGSFSSHPSGGDVSLLTQQPQELSRLGDNVAGQLSLSLSSELPHTEGRVGDETSLGILDLDNIHESSMSVFLTSPRTTQDLVGFHAPSFSASRPLTSASLALPTSPVPSMGPLRISGATAPVGGSVLVGDKQETEGERVGELVEEEVRLPENLLEVSGSVEYSSEGEDDGSQTTGSGGDRESPMEHDAAESTAPSVSIPDQPTWTRDRHANEPSQQGLPQFHTTLKSPPVLGEPSLKEESGGGFSVAEILRAAESRADSTQSGLLFLGSITAASLITDQQEPSIMKRAAELSRFEPEHLTSMMERESLLQHRPHPPAVSSKPSTVAAVNTTFAGSGSEVSAVGGSGSGDMKTEDEANISDLLLLAETTSPEGLPSAYLHQTSSLHSSASQTPSHHTASHSPSPPISPPPSDTQPAGEVGREPVYNPFDSEGLVIEAGDEEFGKGLDSESFMAQLREDEAAIAEANRLMLPEGFVAGTPSSFGSAVSSSLPLPLSGVSGKRELSIGAYFGQRSEKLGELQASGVLLSSERPQFSLLTKSTLPTPPLSEEQAPQTSAPVPKTTPESLDTTLVATEDESLGEDQPHMAGATTAPLQQPHSLPAAGEGAREVASTCSASLSITSARPQLQKDVSHYQTHVSTSFAAASGLVTEAKVSEVMGQPCTVPLATHADNLTPVVTVHTPFLAQFHVPRLNLSGLSNATPSSSSDTTSTLTHSLPAPLPTVTAITPSALNVSSATATPTAGMGIGLQKSGMDSGLSSGMEHRLASHYWKPSSGTSTLLFPELSTTSLSPPPSEVAAGLSSMPTPSLAHFSVGFSTTAADSRDTSFLESLLGPLPVSSTTADLPLLDYSSKASALSQPLLSPSASLKTAVSKSPGREWVTTTLVSSDTSPPVTGSTLTSLVLSPESGRAGEKDLHKASSEFASYSKTSPSDGGKRNIPHIHSPPVSSAVTRLGESPSSGKTKFEPFSSAPSLTSPHNTATTGGRAEETQRKERPLSPRTDGARRKISQLKAALDATEFNAAAFLSRLEGERNVSTTAHSPARSSVGSTTTEVGQTRTISTASAVTAPVSRTSTTASAVTTPVSRTSTTASGVTAPVSRTSTTASAVTTPVSRTSTTASGVTAPVSRTSTTASAVTAPVSRTSTTASAVTAPVSRTSTTASAVTIPVSCTLTTASAVTTVVSQTRAMTTVVNQMATIASAKTTAVSQTSTIASTMTTAVVSTTTTAVSKTPTIASAMTTAVSKPFTMTTAVSKPLTMTTAVSKHLLTAVSQPLSTAVSKPLATTTAVSKSPRTTTTLVVNTTTVVSSPVTPTGAILSGSALHNLSPSPPRPPHISSGTSPPITEHTSTAAPSTASLIQTQLTEAAGRGERVPPEGSRSPQRQPPAVRDIGVGTTPGLHRGHSRASSHKETHTTSVNITQPQPSTDTARTVLTYPQSRVSQPPLSSSVVSSPKREPSLSGSQPIYTSPRLLPHTSLSPPPQPRPQLPPTPGRDRRKTPKETSLKVPDSLCFKSPCCTGVTLHDELQISNLGDRWLQLSFELCELYCNGLAEADTSSFSFPQRCFIGPRKTESIKIAFSPKRAGSYEVLLACKARLVVTTEKDDSNFIQQNVVVKALAVVPILDLATPLCTSDEICLDYGLLVAGTPVSLPLSLTNRGSSELPLRLTISAPTLSQLYFSFNDPPPSLKPSPLSSSYVHSRPFSTSVTLPPKPLGKDTTPDTHSININFKSPKSFGDESTPLGPPEEIQAQLNISVDSANSTDVLHSVPIRATVGVARLHVPRSLQALSLSCLAGQTITREVPFKNAGNIPLNVAFEFSSGCDHFAVSPDFLEMSASEEAAIKVSFSPPSSPLVETGMLMVHVQPHGPSYELKVQGSASEVAATDESRENLLFCNKRWVYWGAVDVGATAEQTLLLQNSFSSPVSLQFSIRQRDQGCFLLAMDSLSLAQEHEAEIAEHGQLKLTLYFSPQSQSISSNALDILDTIHSRKFRIPLCGYGGQARLEVINAHHSTSGRLWVDLGPVTLQRKSTVKLSLYNSGSRAGFVKMMCVSLNEGEEVLPTTQASVSPSQCILQPRQKLEVTLSYQPLSEDEVAKYAEKVSPLARLVLVHGDELARQRFRQGMAADRERREGGEGQQLSNEFNECLLQEFLGQKSVDLDSDFFQFEVENEEEFFELQLRQTEITLSGSPVSEKPAPSKSHGQSSSSPPLSSEPLQQPSPPHTVDQSPLPGQALSQSAKIVSSFAILLPDTTSGQRSEKALDVHNPYSQPMTWRLTSVASAFMRDTHGVSSDIRKVNNSVFLVQEKRGSVAPHSTAQVPVVFQPLNAGSFSQIWDLQVSCTEIESGIKRVRLSFGGKASSRAEQKLTTPHRVRFVSPPPPQSPSPISHTVTASHHHTVTTSHTHTLTGTTKRAVYIKEEMVEFPRTQVGKRSVLKVKVCNRNRTQHQFNVVSLSPPFSVDHHTFLLGSRQCARLPVHFSPTRPGVYEAVLAVRTDAGHQAFTQLTASATTEDE